MREPISVSVFLYRETRNQRQYLLLKRVPRPDLALSGFWQSVTGGKELGESLQKAAIREVFEESGICISNIGKSIYQYEYAIKPEWQSKYAREHNTIQEFVFSAPVSTDPILSSEHCEFGWFSFERAKAMLEFQLSIKALAVIEASLAT
ncbi:MULTISPECIES: NUDIX pyrophosphatase [unclassified Oleiphilus]|nr:MULTISPECIES: NUDIX domain-containing protein [unclassified Oleiphilus]KZY44084.1 hypothetical protein A3732_13005 [Oleiphilus sp. HI0050]KZY73378.1 hypothetical protein A3740_03415 [Oleiphilus sp. HI0068]KZY77213.1 hypothetical protein A3741_10040 [Oleiphilus sp. HI0069]KZY88011.1 hypothetical protein A3743_12925 [Oleiphilus sp. HI0072]KZZ14619.1 hypothetical protein A3749_05335 [Oleiphilus sp. HI0078]KZZ28898.1 hypothetical protein A3752_20330 [Oleiphilus sp. HI0081]KZZ30728.1 hypotheti